MTQARARAVLTSRAAGRIIRTSAVRTFQARADQTAELLAVAASEAAADRGAKSVTAADVIAGHDRLLSAHDLIRDIRSTLEQHIDELEALEDKGLRHLARANDA
jgi:hypothetical protein